METKKHCFDFRQYRTQQELPEQERLLIGKAAEACGSAYAPYSGFRVGAAVLLDDDEILTASNQESEVFPSGMCAERSLLYYVQANRPGRTIRTMAIASAPSPRECTPCGAEKRQQAPIRIVMSGAGRAIVVEEAKLLLPFTFELE